VFGQFPFRHRSESKSMRLIAIEEHILPQEVRDAWNAAAA